MRLTECKPTIIIVGRQLETAKEFALQLVTEPIRRTIDIIENDNGVYKMHKASTFMYMRGYRPWKVYLDMEISVNSPAYKGLRENLLINVRGENIIWY